MSNSTDTTGCISHKRNKRFFVMYEDYLEIASVSKHQYKLAAFWRVLETKTNDRITYNQGLIEEAKKKGEPEPETTLWIEVPYSEYVNRALGIYKSSSFQVAAAESERLGFSASRVLQRKINPQDPQSPKEDYKEYLYLTDRMQSVLDGGEYPTPIEINSPLLKGIEERQKRKAIEKNGTPIEINSHNDETPVDFNGTPLLKSTSNKYISNNSLKNIGNIESLLSDDNLLTREEKIAEIEALLQELRSQSTPHQGNDQNAPDPGGDTNILPKGSASPTLAGRNTAVDEANHHADADNMVPDHNAIPEPPCSATDGLTQESATTPRSETTPSESQCSDEKSTSSTQPVHELITQEIEQTDGVHPIATGATKTPQSDTTPVQPATHKPRGDRGKSAASAEKEERTRLQALVDSFIALGREHFNQPGYTVDLGSPRSDNYKGALSIINVATTKGVRDVYLDFWNEADKNDPDVHWWQDPKHLTFKAFCRGYSTRITSIQFNAEKKQAKSSHPKSISGHRNYTYNPPVEERVATAPPTEPTLFPIEQEHPGPAPRRIRFHRVSEIQDAINARHNVVAQ